MPDEKDIRDKIAAFNAIITSLSQAKDAFIENEFRRIFDSEEVRANAEEITPYIYSALLLSLSGREINEVNIREILTLIGITFNGKMLDILQKTNVRTHIPYINAYYFLLAVGITGTEDKILEVVRILGIKADSTRIKDVISFLTHA